MNTADFEAFPFEVGYEDSRFDAYTRLRIQIPDNGRNVDVVLTGELPRPQTVITVSSRAVMYCAQRDR
ncbi:MAG: hypothetical protein ABL995_20885 [Bryobacteraceae bacterium]